MRSLRAGANFTVFLLFFGLSLLDALWSGHWIRAGLWLLFGLLFLRADAMRAGTRSSSAHDG